jgi:hypothetical protein
MSHPARVVMHKQDHNADLKVRRKVSRIIEALADKALRLTE